MVFCNSSDADGRQKPYVCVSSLEILEETVSDPWLVLHACQSSRYWPQYVKINDAKDQQYHVGSMYTAERELVREPIPPALHHTRSTSEMMTVKRFAHSGIGRPTHVCNHGITNCDKRQEVFNR